MQHASGVFEVSILDRDFKLHLVHKNRFYSIDHLFLVMLPIPVINITNDSIFRIFAGGGASEPGGHLSLLHRLRLALGTHTKPVRIMQN